MLDFKLIKLRVESRKRQRALCLLYNSKGPILLKKYEMKEERSHAAARS